MRVHSDNPGERNTCRSESRTQVHLRSTKRGQSPSPPSPRSVGVSNDRRPPKCTHTKCVVRDVPKGGLICGPRMAQFLAAGPLANHRHHAPRRPSRARGAAPPAPDTATRAPPPPGGTTAACASPAAPRPPPHLCDGHTMVAWPSPHPPWGHHRLCCERAPVREERASKIGAARPEPTRGGGRVRRGCPRLHAHRFDCSRAVTVGTRRQGSTKG